MPKIIGTSTRAPKVFQQLSQLPNPYTLILNYKLPVSPYIWINHLVIGPTGLYLIFTKNRDNPSHKSTPSESFIKYLEQMRRNLHTFINRAIKHQRPDSQPYTTHRQSSFRKRKLPWFDHHWSASSIPIQIILCHDEDTIPAQSRNFKILSTSQLSNYIHLQDPCLDPNQVTSLCKYLRHEH